MGVWGFQWRVTFLSRVGNVPAQVASGAGLVNAQPGTTVSVAEHLQGVRPAQSYTLPITQGAGSDVYVQAEWQNAYALRADNAADNRGGYGLTTTAL